LPLEVTSKQELFVGSFLKWVSMAEQPHTSLISPCIMPSVSWSVVKVTTIGLWSTGNTFFGVLNHTSPSGSPTDESEFGVCQKMYARRCMPVWYMSECIVPSFVEEE
jgi:hypothetical protein